MTATIWEDELREVRGRYARRLPEKLDLLESTLRAARCDPDAPLALDSARNLAHMLKGSSGTYGFDALSAALERIEEQLARLLAEPSNPAAAAAWTAIDAALSQARAGLREHGNPPS